MDSHNRFQCKLTTLLCFPYLHLCEHHSADFLCSKQSILSLHSHLDVGFVVLFLCQEGEVFHVLLHCRIVPCPTNHSFCIKDCIFRVCCELIFGCVSNESFTFGSESHVGGCDSVSLVICNDFNTTTFVDSNTVLCKRERKQRLIFTCITGKKNKKKQHTNKCLKAEERQNEKQRQTSEASYSPRVSSSQVNSNHRPHVLLLSVTIPRSSSQLHTYRQQA